MNAVNHPSFLRLAGRVLSAHDTDAGAREVMQRVSNPTLARLGLSHRRSGLGVFAMLVATFSLGAAAGAAVALVIAPASGRRLGHTVRTRLKALTRRAERGATDAVVKDATPDASPETPHGARTNGPVS